MSLRCVYDAKMLLSNVSSLVKKRVVTCKFMSEMYANGSTGVDSGRSFNLSAGCGAAMPDSES